MGTEALISFMTAAAVYRAISALPRRDRVAGSRLDSLAVASGRKRGFEPRAVLEFLGKRANVDEPHLQDRLDMAGVSMTVRSFAGAGLALATCGAALGLLVGTVFNPLAALALSVAGGAGGQRLPGWMLARRLARRRKEIVRDLTDCADLLAVCTGAGLNVALALQRVAQRATGACAQELSRVVKEVELGVARRDALAGFVERTGVEEAGLLAATLDQAEQFGVGVARSLAEFARELRRTRRRQSEEQARKAPIKMLFPLVFFILPAFALLTVVPLLLGTLSSIGF